jgi:hypothetical protein
MVQVRQDGFGKGIAIYTRDIKSPTQCVCNPEEQEHEEDFDFDRTAGNLSHL